jgi:steroid delta-isomerase-like uncharacterized protein
MNPPINTTQDIFHLLEQLGEAWNDHNIESALRFYAADYEGFDISETAPRRGQHGAREWMNRYWQASPDMRVAVNQTVIEGNRAAVSWTARGTHQGYLMHIPPTGRAFAVRGVSFLTIKNSQIQRGEYIWDLAELLRCIRLLPELYEEDGNDVGASCQSVR